MKTEVFMDGRRKEIFMNIIKKFKDNFGNIAAIEQTETFPYRGAGKKTSCFRLCLMAEYDDGFIYHVSCYDTLADALLKLSRMSCGTFIEMEWHKK